MKKLFFIILPLFFFIVKSLGQDLSLYTYIYSNSDVSLSIKSDSSFSIQSQWCKEILPSDVITENSEATGMIKWSEGKVKMKGNMIICMDSRNKKTVTFQKINEDIIKVLNWEDYKNKNDKSNLHRGWNNNSNKTVYLADLFSNEDSLFIYLISKKDLSSNKTSLLKLYNWKSGVKSIIYEARDKPVKD